MTTLRLASVILAAAAGLAACGSAAQPAASSGPSAAASTMADKASPDKSMPAGSGSQPTMAAGMYLSYADYQQKMSMIAGQGSKVVLFFHAPWCPDCRATDSSLTGSGVPAGLAVVKVDYDTATELKQKYGITQQHTFVQIDASGTQVKKWTGTKDGASIKGQIA